MNEGEAKKEEEQDTESLAESVDGELSDELQAVQGCEFQVSLCRTVGSGILAACVWNGHRMCLPHRAGVRACRALQAGARNTNKQQL